MSTLSPQRLCFGGAALSGEGGGYGFGAMSEKNAEGLIKEAYALGIRDFDTAPIYGYGLSEERLGRYLPADARVISKAGVDWHESRRVNMSNEPAIVEKMLLASLKRLKRASIDFYMIHWPDEKVDIRRSLEVLLPYQQRGVIKKIGLCNTHPADLAKAREVVEIAAVQSEYNALEASRFEGLDGEFARMGWGTFDKGILTGRVNQQRKFEASDCRSWAPWWNKDVVRKKIERVERLKRALIEQGISLSQFALHFSLLRMDLALVGVKNSQDLSNLLEDLTCPIQAETFQAIERVWSS